MRSGRTRVAGGSHGRRLLSVGALALVLAGCAAQRPLGAYPGSPAPPDPAERPPAAAVLNILAAPLYLGFKAAVCAVTAVIAVPAVAIAAVSDPYGTGWQRQDLADGFAANCGPPYVPF